VAAQQNDIPVVMLYIPVLYSYCNSFLHLAVTVNRLALKTAFETTKTVSGDGAKLNAAHLYDMHATS